MTVLSMTLPSGGVPQQLDVERAKEILAECKTTDEARGIKDKALAVAVYLRAKKAATDARNDAQEIAARAERRMGEILAKVDLHKGGRPRKAKGEKPIPEQGEDNRPTLESLELTPKESSRAQRLAAIPEGEFAKRIAAIRAEGDLITAKKLMSSAQGSHDGDEWQTPEEYVERARRVLGKIDVDPASSEEAQRIVKAAVYYTKKHDGLAQAWKGKVWLNPPYSAPLCGEFVAKLITEFGEGRTRSAVLLVNNATDTSWFQDLLGLFPCLLTKGRIGFVQPGGKKADSNRQGQAFFFLGCKTQDILAAFGDVGTLVIKASP